MGQNISDYYTKVNVYYDKFERTVIKQVPRISPQDLFANIAGVTGLMVGASLLSFVELLEIIPVLLYIFISETLSSQFGGKKLKRYQRKVKAEVDSKQAESVQD